MTDVITTLKNVPDYIGGNGRKEEEIKAIEEKLGLVFSSDYRLYLKEIGLACYSGHELTGICKDKRLNVMDITLEEKTTKEIPADWYVIEQTNIDGIVIWQVSTGEIYQTNFDGKAEKLCESLKEYIENF